ncbi:MAG: tRNA (adenosine(37)-N6)-threonylcarbamoyltransferase complex ATPase subunit type 1 TsaE [Acidimicrobiia bacterium]
MMLRARTTGVDQTRALAAAIAELATAGDVLLLSGELGAGKTAFVQGFGDGLGVEDRITSPTFTLAHHYDGGRLSMHHLDVYRLERLAEMEDIGVSELLDGDGVLLIEWGDAVAPALPQDYLEVALTYGEGDDDRELELRCVGGRWSARHRSLVEHLQPWVVS